MAHAGGTDPEPEQLPPAAAGAGGAADGFSLLEVLVATALMGLVMVVVLQLLTTALRCQETSWSRTQAVLAAEKAGDDARGRGAGTSDCLCEHR